MQTQAIHSGDLRRRQSAIELALRSLWDNRVLAWETAKRELLAVNKGSILGLGWLVIRPAIQTAAYVVVISVIFGVRLGPALGHFDYALYVLSGMAPWQLTARLLEDSPSLIRTRIDILRQVIYPLEILPLTSIVLAGVGPLILLIAFFLLAGVTGQLHWTAMLLPLPVVLLLVLLIGTAWTLMVIGLIFADIREVIGVLLGLMVYMSPVVLAPAMTTPKVWQLVLLNPMSHIVLCFRDVLTAEFHPWSWALFGAMAAAAVAFGGLALSGAKQIFSEYA